MGLEEKITPLWEEIDRLTATQKRLKKDLEELRETKAVCEEVANDADEKIDLWERLRESLEDGKTICEPKEKSTTKKRKGKSKEKVKSKKRKRSLDDDEDSDFIETETDSASEHELSDEETTDEAETKVLLTEEVVSAKLQELRLVV